MSHESDWIEAARRLLYPRLHPLLHIVGLYSVGPVSEAQHVATIQMGEEEFEKYILHAPHRFERNPIASYKTAPDGRKSTLSLRLTHAGSEHYNTQYVDEKKQLHWTLFNAADGVLDLYAHYEYDWQVAPVKHLRGEGMSDDIGRAKSLLFLRDATGLEKGDDYYIND